MVGGVGFGFVGQQYIASGVAAVIFSLSPVVTALVAWRLLPAERLGGRDYLAVLVGFVGVAVVVDPDPTNLLDDAAVGKLLVFVAVAVTALGAVLVRRSGTGLPPSALTGWGMLLGSVVHLLVAAAVGESVASVRPTPLAAATVVYLAVVVGGVGFAAYLTLIDRVGPLRANLTAYVTPLVAIVVGWGLLAERVEPTTVVGFCIIVAGFALLERRELVAELARYRPLVR
jgi:drug/metabolite transporter (DMT)-like permease